MKSTYYTMGLVLVGGLALSGCGLTSTTKMIEIAQAERAAEIPEWYVDLPEDDEDTIHGAGTGLSSDLQFSMDKAMHQAKVTLGDKINNKVSMEMKTYIADNSQTGFGMAVEETQKVSKSGYKQIDVSEYVVVDKAVRLEGMSYRTYVLMSIDPAGRKVAQQPQVSQADIAKAQESARQSLNELD
tara:strand:- start:702 stop:1256 length:555 start_codon:yes stop_codon:yes gene_type:complete